MASTQTGSLATAMAPIKSNIGGVNQVFGSYTAGGTSLTAAVATTILLCKIPNKSTITGIYEYHGSSSASAPTDIGVTGAAAAFATAATVAAATTITGLPYDISVSDDAADKFRYLTATVTPGTTTATFLLNFVVSYVMD